MTERMNKERAIEILKRIQEEKNHDDIKNAKQFLKNLTSDTDRDFDEDYINSIKKYIETAEEELQALDIAIESLQDEDLDISMDWLDEFIDWAKHRVKYTHEHYSDIINIQMTDNELIRIIKILENYKVRLEPYKRKE